MLKWSADYKVGVDIIDESHKKIIDEFENLYNKMHDGQGHEFYEHILEFLDMYVEEHFESEEKFQLEIDYPLLEAHKEIHEEFRSKVKSIEEKHRGKEVTNKDLIEINLTLKNWLIHHILEEDKKIGEYYKSKQDSNNSLEDNATQE